LGVSFGSGPDRPWAQAKEREDKGAMQRGTIGRRVVRGGAGSVAQRQRIRRRKERATGDAEGEGGLARGSAVGKL